MSEVIDELVVKITADASDLESTINSVASELSKLEQIQGKSNGATASGTKGLDAYKKQMSEAETTLSKSRTALANTKKAYEDNSKSVTKNVSALKTQKTELDKQISLRSNEKRLLTEANKHLDKNSVAYKDNQKALNWINTEIDSYTAQSKKISDSIRTQETALAGSKKAYTDAQATVKQATQQYKEYENGLEAVERAAKAQSLQDTGKQWKEVGEGIDTITKPIQYTAMAFAAGGVAAAKFAIDFEDNFANVKKTVDGTPEQLDAIKQSIIDMSTVGINGHSAIPMTTDKLNELAAAGGQLGITVDNIADFTEVMAQMETATNLAGEEGAATLARFQNVMGISQGEIRNVGSAIVDLGNHSATTEAEIAAMALRMGKYGQTVGMSAADVLGYSAALSSLGIEAQMGGSAVGRTWLSIETAVANGGESLKAFAKYAGTSAKEFKEQWNTDSKGAFNGLLKGLQSADNLTIALKNIGVENTQDIQAMMALVNGYDLVTESVDRANTAYTENTALQEEFDRKAETTASQLAVTKQNFIEAARSIGETMLPTIKDVSVGAAGFAKNLASMDDGAKKFLVGTGSVVVGLGAASKGLASTIKTTGEIKEAFGKLKDNKTLQNIITTMSAMPLPAKLAAAGIIGVTAATVAGVKAYANYQYEQAHFADGAKEASAALQKQKSALDEVNNYTWEFKDLQLKLNSEGISEEEKNSITSRMQEISEWFKKNYEVELKVESGSVETAAENVKNLDANLSHVKIDTEIQGNNTLSELIDGLEQFQNAPASRDTATSQAKEWEAEANRMLDAKKRVSDIAAQVRLIQSDALKSDGEKLNEIKKYEAQYQKVLKDLYPDGGDDYNNLLGAFSHIDASNPFDIRYEDAAKQAAKFTAEAELAQEQFEKYQQTAKDYISQQNEMLSYDIGNGDDYSERIKKIGYAAQMAELPLGEVAAQTSAAQNGFKTFADAAAQGGEALDNTIANAAENMQSWGAGTDEIIRYSGLMKTGFGDIQSAIQANKLDDVIANVNTVGKQMGLTAEQIVSNAAMIKTGFTDVNKVIEAGAVSNVVHEMAELGAARGIDMTADKLTQMAQAINLIPADKRINITADGYEIVDDITSKIQNLDGKTFITTFQTDGDTSGADNVDSKAKKLDGKKCSVMFTADGTPAMATIDGVEYKIANYDASTGTATLLAKNGDAIAVIDLTTGKITAIPEEHNTEITATDNTGDGVQSAKNQLSTLPDSKEINITTVFTTKFQTSGDSNYNKFNTGNQFGGLGLAKGTSYAPGGAAVVNDDGKKDPRELIVDRGQAYIPQGRNVLVNLSRGAKVYTSDQTKAIMRGIGIPHYASGKNNSDAFTSAKDDWTHYTKTHSVTTAQELEKWLEFQEKYKDNEKDIWDIEEQIFSLQQKITQELNNQSKAYLEERSALNDWEDIGDSPLEAFARIKDRNYQDLQDAKITWDEYTKNVSDAGETLYDGMLKQSDNWLEHQRKYHNMSIDDYIAGIDREEARLEEFYANDAVNHQKYIEEYQALEEKRFDAVAEKNADEYTAWKKDADAWQEMRSTYDDWDKYGDSEEDFLKRKIDRVKKFYEAGRISFEEYIDDTNRYSMDLYKAQEGYVDDLLQKQSDYISELREQFSEQEQALRDSWDVEDRKADMSDVQNQLDIYAGAVTDRGQQKYKELQEQMKQLQRDEELYNLQVANNATIENLEAEYKQMEEGKANILEGLRTANINISGYVNSISESLSQTGNNVTSLLSTLIDKFDSFKVESNSMTDNRKYSYNISQMTPEQIQDLLDSIVGK